MRFAHIEWNNNNITSRQALYAGLRRALYSLLIRGCSLAGAPSAPPIAVRCKPAEALAEAVGHQREGAGGLAGCACFARS